MRWEGRAEHRGGAGGYTLKRSMSVTVTVTAQHLAMCVGFGARRGLNVPEFLAWLGVSPQTLADPEGRIPHEIFAAALDEIPQRIGAPYFALELARAASENPPHNLAVLIYASRSCATLGEAYATTIRFLRIIHDAAAIRMDVDGDEARLFLRPSAPIRLPRQAREFMFAMLMLHGRKSCGEVWSPRIVRFEHESPGDLAPYEQIFGAPIEFGAPVSEIRFDRALLDKPLIAADAALYAVIQKHAEEMLRRIPRLDEPTDRVRQCVATMVCEGMPAIERVARHVGTSRRSLQRMLRDSGVTYRQLVDDVRRELAVRHVADRARTLPEIAFLLGFSEAPAFHRAFRRWTGMSPGQYRQRGTTSPPLVRDSLDAPSTRDSTGI